MLTDAEEDESELSELSLDFVCEPLRLEELLVIETERLEELPDDWLDFVMLTERLEELSELFVTEIDWLELDSDD